MNASNPNASSKNAGTSSSASNGALITGLFLDRESAETAYRAVHGQYSLRQRIKL